MSTRLSRPRLGFGILGALALTVLWGCEEETAPPPPPPNTTPSSVTINAGDNQSATAGSAVSTDPAVEVRNSDGAVLANTTVTFAVTGGGGSVGSATATTDAQGIASTSWTLGTSAGANTMTATAGTVTPVTFNATGTAGSPTAPTVSAGDNQTATTGNAVPIPPEVSVEDANGNPIQGVSVDFNVTVGGGSVTGSPATTDANGIAAVGSWVMGPQGAQELEADIPGVGSVTFSAFSVGIPASIAIVAGDGQTADAGTAVATAPAVEVRDAGNNLLEMIDVTFAVTGGGGSVSPMTVSTNSSGVATLGSWTLGTTPGANTMDATVAGVGAPASFTATGVVGPAAQIVVVSGDGQSATVGTALANPVVFAIQDQFGNGVQGETINLTPDGDGSVSNASPTSDANGEVSETWTLATTPSGSQNLSADAVTGGVTPGAASANATPDSPAALDPDPMFDNQSAVAGTAVPQAPEVTVEDQYGNPVPGVTVDFTPSGDGTVGNSSTTSDANGIASSGSWTLATTAGANTLTVSSTGLGSIVYMATGTAQLSSITVTSGDGQTATVNQTVSGAIVAQVLDQGSNPVPSVNVTFAVTGGGGAVANAAQVTDGSGNATLPGGSWTLGTTSGANQLTVSIDANMSLNAPIAATGDPDVPATATIVSGDDQGGSLNAQLAQPVIVRFEDQFGNPNSGTSVSFTPRSGSGSVANPTQTADAQGQASTTWTLGSTAGTMLLDASAGGQMATFFAIGSSSNYKLEVVFLNGGTIAQKTAFGDAAGRWMDIITGDLGDINFSGSPVPPNTCVAGQPTINFNVDDLLIYSVLEPIDGTGGILGSAGPCLIRTGTDAPLSVVGVMRFDTADLPNLEANGTLGDVILHEMAHVIGLGTLWNQSPLSLLNNPSLPSNPGADTHFDGQQTINAFNALPGGPWVPPTSANSVVPVENTQGAQGTRDGHWRESTFVTELMTGFITGGGAANPLSIVTIESFEDMGYAVDPNQADAYNLATDGDPSGLRAGLRAGTIELKDDILRMPLRAVDSNGRIVRVIPQ